MMLERYKCVTSNIPFPQGKLTWSLFVLSCLTRASINEQINKSNKKVNKSLVCIAKYLLKKYS